MAQTNTNERSPRDLSVPETMKIAALLAELMPPGIEMGSGNEPISIPSGAEDSVHDGHASVLDPPALQMEDLDHVEQEEVDETTVTKLSAELIDSKEIKQAREIPVEPTPALARTAEPVPAPAAVKPMPVPVKAVEPTPAPAKAVETTSAPLDPELIPLGSLTVAGYFSLVNWKNDPKRVRHPRRADYGLDQQTLAQASRNPFYVVGQPRRAEERSVSEVMAEIAWE